MAGTVQGHGRLAAGGEEAWRRLARELHDDHCQRLAAAAFELKAVRRQLAEGDPRRSELDAVGASLAALGEDLRRLSHDLHPATLERRGLAEALRDACAEVERRHGLPVRLSLHGAEALPSALPGDTALGLYRIVQEALANTVRHAGAREAHVTLRRAAGEVHLTVADDGAGFEPDAARRAGGLGLASVEERAALLGGRCRIVSAPGAGTAVDVTVPVSMPTPGVLHRWGRHPRLLTAAALVTLLLSAGLGAAVLEARRADREAARAEQTIRFLETLSRAGDLRQGRFNEEEAALRRKLAHQVAINERTLAPNDPQALRTLALLADLNFRQGRYTDAEPLYRRLLGVDQRGVMLERRDTVLANWACILRTTGREAEAAQVEARIATHRSD